MMPTIGELVVEGNNTYFDVYYHINSRHRLNLSDDLRNQLNRELSGRINEIENTEQNEDLKRHLRRTIRDLE